MYLNKEAFIEFIQENFEGSVYRCAEKLDVWPKGHSNAGLKFMTKLMQYCNKNRLNYQDYIFLE